MTLLYVSNYKILRKLKHILVDELFEQVLVIMSLHSISPLPHVPHATILYAPFNTLTPPNILLPFGEGSRHTHFHPRFRICEGKLTL